MAGLGNMVQMPKKRKEMIAVLDDNNEVMAFEPLQKGNGLGRDWVAVFQTSMGWLARQGLTGEQWNVFAFLIEHLSFENWLRVRQAEIGEALGIKRCNVSRAMKRLLELDIITKGPAAGKANTYRLNPRLAHRGAKNYRSNIVQYDKLRAQQVNK